MQNSLAFLGCSAPTPSPVREAQERRTMPTNDHYQTNRKTTVYKQRRTKRKEAKALAKANLHQFVTINGIEILVQLPDSTLIKLSNTREIWVPRAHIALCKEGKIEVTEWFAKKVRI
jgi:hypothetical protein